MLGPFSVGRGDPPRHRDRLARFVGLSIFGSLATTELDPRIRAVDEAPDEPGYHDAEDVPEDAPAAQRLGSA